jgi:hypothetical protein
MVIVAALVALLFLRPPPESASTTTRGNVPVSTAHTATQVDDSRDIASSSAALRPPQTPPMTLRVPVFDALPEGLNGRSLNDVYDDWSKRAEKGDADAAFRLGSLVDQCNKILYPLKHGRRGGSPDPAVDRIIREQEDVAGEQCPKLGDDALASAGEWLLQAAQSGHREALLRLRFFAPKAAYDESGAKRARWRSVLVDGLGRLGETGDADAMASLGQFYLQEGGVESAKEAYRWFDALSRAPVPAYRVEFATRMRGVAEDRMNAREANGR